MLMTRSLHWHKLTVLPMLYCLIWYYSISKYSLYYDFGHYICDLKYQITAHKRKITCYNSTKIKENIKNHERTFEPWNWISKNAGLSFSFQFSVGLKVMLMFVLFHILVIRVEILKDNFLFNTKIMHEIFSFCCNGQNNASGKEKCVPVHGKLYIGIRMICIFPLKVVWTHTLFS